MCKWGNTVIVEIHSSVLVDVDSCIAPLVKTLNANGFRTIASCCGHGNRPGNIALRDGRELIISPSREATVEMEKNYPDIHGDFKEEE